MSKKVNQQPELKKLKADLDAAQQAYITAFEAAMTKEDPQIIAQYKALREEMMQKIHHPLPPAGVVQSTAKSGYNQLSDAERQRLYEARKAAVETPAVRNARQKRNAAKTEEERNAADAEYRIALGKAMIEQDPKLQEVIDKMEGKASTKETASALPAVSPTASGSPSPSPAAGIK